MKNKPIEALEDQTLMQADVARKSLSQLREAVQELLPEGMAAEKKRSIAKLLSMGKWTHDYPLKYETLDAMGVPVTTEVPEQIYDLLSLYPQPTRRQGGVEFLPNSRERNRNSQPSAPTS